MGSRFMSAPQLLSLIPITTLVFVVPILATPLNTTALLQNLPGTDFTNHGNPKLLCRPARWYDVAIFFFGNYLAHAATVRSDPGQSVFKSCYNIVIALLSPTAGVFRGISAINSGAIFEKTSLKTALKAGALCEPFKDPESFGKGWKWSIGLMSTTVHFANGKQLKCGRCERCEQCRREQQVEGQIGMDESERHQPEDEQTDGIENFEQRNRKIPMRRINKTRNYIDDGLNPEKWYRKPFVESKPGLLNIASNYNILKISASLFQTVFTLWTIYTTRGDQTSRFGYAAFGLTVVPYFWMSFINLLGHLVCPEYPAMYEIDLPYQNDEEDLSEIEISWSSPLLICLLLTSGLLFLGIMAAPIAVIGGLSGFQPGRSTMTERVWTMLWLGSGILTALLRSLIRSNWRQIPEERINQYKELWTARVHREIILVVMAAVPAIGGFITVGKEILEYGSCEKVS